MIGRLCRALALLLAVIASPVSAKAPDEPALIVTLVVDQFAADLFEQYRPTFTGGLKRMADGLAFVDGYQSHAATETCPGHSTILTGRHPSRTGIVANSWFDRASGRFLYCVAVPGADVEARGPQTLRVDTLGTWLKASEPRAQVVSVSGKDRAAIMLGGHHADAVYWWQDGSGFGSAPTAGPTGAAVSEPARRFDSAVLARWRAAPPALWPTQVSQRCAALERPARFGDVSLSGRIPPDGTALAADDKAFSGALHASPLFDQLTLDFAADLVAARKLGSGPATDLLAVSLSATDYIGHAYGKGGPEMCVQMAALDMALDGFFRRLDALQRPYVVVLTADHGSSDAAERVAQAGLAAARVDGRALIAALNAHLQQSLGLAAAPIHGVEPQDLAIDAGSDPALYRRIRDEAVRWLEAQPHVAQVLTRDEVALAAPRPGTSPGKLTTAERFHESFDPERSGDVFVLLDQNVEPFVARPGSVAGHGTPWDYDRRVPILFWWPGVTAESKARPIETVDIAPTLAAIAGVPTPLLDGKCLPEVTDCAVK